MITIITRVLLCLLLLSPAGYAKSEATSPSVLQQLTNLLSKSTRVQALQQQDATLKQQHQQFAELARQANADKQESASVSKPRRHQQASNERPRNFDAIQRGLEQFAPVVGQDITNEEAKQRIQQMRERFLQRSQQRGPNANNPTQPGPEQLVPPIGKDISSEEYQQQIQKMRERFLQRRQQRQTTRNNSTPSKNPPAPRRVDPSNQSQNDQVWNLRNADIRQVISAVSRETGKRFVIDPRVQGKVTLIANEPINKKTLYQVFLSMLQVAGYSAIDQGHITKIIPNNQTRTSATPLVSGMKQIQGDDVIARVIPVKYVAADQLVPVLRPLLPSWGLISAYRPSNSLIIVGEADNVNRLLGIVQHVDTASHNGIDIVPLRYAIATDVVKTINALNQGRANNTGPRVSVASDDHSNSVLISGPRSTRLQTKVLVSQLDSQSPSGSGNTQVVYLEYMQAKDIVPILAGVARSQFSGTVGTTIGTMTINEAPPLEGFSNSSSTGSASSPSLPNSTARTTNINANQSAQSQTNQGTAGPKIEIIAEPNSNAVILNAPPNIMRVLKSVIAKVDIRPAQVLVEALIAEVNENNIQNLGIEWGQLSNASISDDSSGIFQSGFGFINKDFFHDLVGTLRFLANEDLANMLSTPSIVVLDNHLAHIRVGSEVSIIRSEQLANTDANGTPFNTFDREQVGLLLNVTPQITKHNSIKLSISHQNNSPTNLDDTSGRQAFNISEIQTSVIVRSGDVVVLGGLTQNQYLNNTTKTPYLGDVPGFGNLLKRSQKTRNRKKLMVFLRPIILRTPQQHSVYVTNSKYNSLRDAQVSMMSDVPYQHKPQEYVLPQNKKREHLPPPFMPYQPTHAYHKGA